jgi:hypothetical protein
MKRRKAIKSIIIASTATVFFSGCSDTNVIEFIRFGKLTLNQKHKDYLAMISETFLPISGVSENIGDPVEFILTMLNDCSSQQEISDFAEGFEQYKSLMKESKLRIKKADPDQVLEVVKAVLDGIELSEALLFFIQTVRNRSIQNLKSSEYYLSEYLDYQLIPTEYIPCLDV